MLTLAFLVGGTALVIAVHHPEIFRRQKPPRFSIGTPVQDVLAIERGWPEQDGIVVELGQNNLWPYARVHYPVSNVIRWRAADALIV